MLYCALLYGINNLVCHAKNSVFAKSGGKGTSAVYSRKFFVFAKAAKL